METCRHIADQLSRTFDGAAWHGDSIMQLLSDIDAEHAANKSLQNIHSIWEIVLHLIAWEEIAIQCLQGQAYIMIHGEDDWPPVKAATPEAWHATVQQLKDNSSTLDILIANFQEESLHEQVPGQEFSYYQLFHGLVQHNLYHAGQIGILKKL